MGEWSEEEVALFVRARPPPRPGADRCALTRRAGPRWPPRTAAATSGACSPATYRTAWATSAQRHTGTSSSPGCASARSPSRAPRSGSRLPLVSLAAAHWAGIQGLLRDNHYKLTSSGEAIWCGGRSRREE